MRCVLRSPVGSSANSPVRNRCARAERLFSTQFVCCTRSERWDHRAIGNRALLMKPVDQVRLAETLRRVLDVCVVVLAKSTRRCRLCNIIVVGTRRGDKTGLFEADLSGTPQRQPRLRSREFESLETTPRPNISHNHFSSQPRNRPPRGEGSSPNPPWVGGPNAVTTLPRGLADLVGDHGGGLVQAPVAEMGVALGGAAAGVAQTLLDHAAVHPRVGQE